MGIENQPQLNTETENKPSIQENQEEKGEKIRKLFGHCFEISKFEEGDLIPVGGDSIFSSEANIKVYGDFEKFQNFFLKIHEYIEKQNLEEWKKYLVSQNIEIDENLFVALFAFTKAYEKKYPLIREDVDKKHKERQELLFNKKEVKLSEIFDKNIGECAEIAALTQVFLQKEGISSSYFSGDVLWNKQEEFSEEHSFIILRQGSKVYIYDPANPTDTTSGKFPSLYATEAKFDEEMNKGEKKFVTSKNILSKKEAFYGVNNGTDVWVENIV